MRIIEKRELYGVLLESKQYVNNLKQWVEYLLTKLSINDLLKDSEIYPDELENLEHLIMTLGDEKYKKYDLTKFSRLGKPEKQVTLTTRHSSKGLEFEVVIILGVEKGKFPSFECEHNPQKLEEEHRICFVCVSRAKKACVLVRSRVNNIPKKDGGIWRKTTEESIFWTYLVEKYGDDLTEELFE
jgi:DNA helicase II / ATP-dependent DNA helicase PcrA